MTEGEKATVGGLLSMLVLIVPAFVFHAAPRFPGSLAGGIIGIAAALLFVLLLAYVAVKRLPWVKERTKDMASIGALLTFHIYAGVVGALLGIIHSGHKFESPLGIALVVSMLIVIASGFVGRYYLAQVAVELKDQQVELAVLRTRYEALTRVADGAATAATGSLSGGTLIDLLGAISDREFTITTREGLKSDLMRWVIVHIVAAIAMYALLILHVWSGIYYGLRWLA